MATVGTLETVMETARAVMASLAISYEVDSGIKQDLNEVYCMAKTVYFEARHESTLGKIGVAHVTMNRVEDKRWPSTVCNVVMAGPIRESWKTRILRCLRKKGSIILLRIDVNSLGIVTAIEI